MAYWAWFDWHFMGAYLAMCNCPPPKKKSMSDNGFRTCCKCQKETNKSPCQEIRDRANISSESKVGLTGLEVS